MNDTNIKVACFAPDQEELKQALSRYLKFILCPDSIELYVVSELFADCVKGFWDAIWNQTIEEIPPVVFINVSDSERQGAMSFLRLKLPNWQTWDPPQYKLKYLLSHFKVSK
jgi:hypothetical protein